MFVLNEDPFVEHKRIRRHLQTFSAKKMFEEIESRSGLNWKQRKMLLILTKNYGVSKTLVGLLLRRVEDQEAF